MKEPVPIQYREFYDYPRVFIAWYGGVQFLFDGGFNEQLDEYPDEYEVLVLPHLRAEELSGSWANLATLATKRVGRVKASCVAFDSTRRQSIDGSLLRELVPARSAG